MDVIFSK